MNSIRDGSEAMGRGDWEDTYRLFRKAIELVPDNLLFRQTLRGTATKLAEQRRFTVFDKDSHLSKLQNAIAVENWTEADRLAEDGLHYLPRDADLNVALARTTQHLGYPDIARFALECALRSDCNHIEAIQLAFEFETDFAKPLMKHLLHKWKHLPADTPLADIERRRIIGEHVMLSHITLGKGSTVPPHAHPNEQMVVVLSGHIRFELGEPDSGDVQTLDVKGGEVLHLPPNLKHSAVAIEKTIVVDVFSPPSETTGIDE